MQIVCTEHASKCHSRIDQNQHYKQYLEGTRAKSNNYRYKFLFECTWSAHYFFCSWSYQADKRQELLEQALLAYTIYNMKYRDTVHHIRIMQRYLPDRSEEHTSELQ